MNIWMLAAIFVGGLLLMAAALMVVSWRASCFRIRGRSHKEAPRARTNGTDCGPTRNTQLPWHRLCDLHKRWTPCCTEGAFWSWMTNPPYAS